MKKTFYGIKFIPLLPLLLGLHCVFFGVSEGSAIVTFKRGQVYLIGEKTGGKRQTLPIGGYIRELESIETGRESYVEVALKGHGFIRIGEKSLAHIKDLKEGRKTSINFDRGTFGALLKNHEGGQLEISTPVMNLSTGDADFVVTTDEGGKNQIVLLEGNVGLEDAKGAKMDLDQPGIATVDENTDLSKEAGKEKEVFRKLAEMTPEEQNAFSKMETQNAFSDAPELVPSSEAEFVAIKETSGGEEEDTEEKTRKPVEAKAVEEKRLVAPKAVQAKKKKTVPQYLVKVCTGEDLTSGTEDMAFIQLFGPGGLKTARYRLDNPELVEFQVGKCDDFRLTDRVILEDLSAIEISLAGRDGWFVKSVDVKLPNGKDYKFPLNTFLDSGGMNDKNLVRKEVGGP